MNYLVTLSVHDHDAHKKIEILKAVRQFGDVTLRKAKTLVDLWHASIDDTVSDHEMRLVATPEQLAKFYCWYFNNSHHAVVGVTAIERYKTDQVYDLTPQEEL